MHRPDEELPIASPPPTKQLRSAPEVPNVDQPTGFWDQATVIRWGLTGLALPLGVWFMVSLSVALADRWSWAWVPPGVGFALVFWGAAKVWHHYLSAEEKARSDERAAKQAALRMRVNQPKGGERQEWT
jgi:hypothetical protein